MSDFSLIIPSAQPPTPELLERYELTHRFYDELKYRQELAEYSNWYHETARQNRAEFERLQQDINLLGWFNRVLRGRG